MSLKIIFTWWNKQTFGTFLKTLFLENMLVLMNMEINIIKVKKMNDGLFTQKILKQLKSLQIGIYGYIIQLIKFQIKKIKIFMAKKTFRKSNRYKNSFKPVKIRKNNIKKKYETWK